MICVCKSFTWVGTQVTHWTALTISPQNSLQFSPNSPSTRSTTACQRACSAALRSMIHSWHRTHLRARSLKSWDWRFNFWLEKYVRFYWYWVTCRWGWPVQMYRSNWRGKDELFWWCQWDQMSWWKCASFGFFYNLLLIFYSLFIL
jgi:hypothetical protein